MTGPHQFLAITGLTLGLAFGSASRAQNAVADWHTITEHTVVSTDKKSPSGAFVYFVYVDVAMYDAVNSIGGRYKPFAVKVHAPPGTSRDAAAATAAHDVLVYYFLAQKSVLDTDWDTSMAAIADGQAKTDGINVGKTVAAKWLALRAG